MLIRLIRRSAIALALGALAAGLGAAASAAADPNRTVARTGDHLIVVGRSLASACYDHARLGHTDRTAREECDLALQESAAGGERAAVYVNRGLVRAAGGDLTGAVADYDAAIALTPDLAEAHLNAARAYAALARWDEADAAYGRAIALWRADDPYTLRNLHFDRAIAREELENYAGAYEDYLRAAELDPEWDAPRRELERFRVSDDGAEDGSAEDGGA